VPVASATDCVDTSATAAKSSEPTTTALNCSRYPRQRQSWPVMVAISPVFVCLSLRTSHVSDHGFSPRHSHTADAASDSHFSVREFFSQLASGKNVAGVGHGTSVSAGFFSFYFEASRKAYHSFYACMSVRTTQ